MRMHCQANHKRGRTGIAHAPAMREHRTGISHPECVERYDAVMAGVAAALPDVSGIDVPPSPVDDETLRQCHDTAYIQLVRREIDEGRSLLSTGDTPIGKGSMEAALAAVGCCIAAVDAVLEARIVNAFCAVRPPGHHAEFSKGMGFCIFNNVALAACHALKHPHVERVLIVDWDVHHGNGTQAIFYDDPRVFYFSTHQWPMYPGTGRADERGQGAGIGTTLNCPLSAGADGKDIISAIHYQLKPALRKHPPDLVIISAGFDGEAGDPLGGFGLQPDDYAALTEILAGVANDHADGRLISVLEGGYRLEGLAECVAAHVRELATCASKRGVDDLDAPLHDYA